MEFHEAANIFPLDEEHLGELADDIRERGQRVPIETLGGKIIDGRRRYLACEEIGVKPKSVAISTADPIAYVLSLNLHRRHLSPTQLAMVGGRADKLREDYSRGARERQKANLKKGSEKPVGENLPQRESGKTRDQIGKLVGVSGKSIDSARTVLEYGTPKLIAAVDADLIAVSTAARAATLGEVEQDALADRAKGAAENGRRRRPRPAEADVKAEPDPDPAARKSRGKGVRFAYEVINCLTGIPKTDPLRPLAIRAINCLIRIPKNDKLRKRGFQIVTDWIRRNG